ncbi:MAG: 50S ribosomal protein L30 [Chitinophagaceae bacterium]
MKKLRITQVKSVIDRLPRQKKTIIALGLKHINDSVELNETDQLKGMIRVVNHLVKVEPIN